TSLAWGRVEPSGPLDYEVGNHSTDDRVSVSFRAADPTHPISYPFTATTDWLYSDCAPAIHYAPTDGVGVVTWTWPESNMGYGPSTCERSASLPIQPIRGIRPKLKSQFAKKAVVGDPLVTFFWPNMCRTYETSALGQVKFVFSYDGATRSMRKADQCDNNFS